MLGNSLGLRQMIGLWITIVAALVLDFGAAELTPPYFNLAEGRKIHATATCGVDTDGPELYCKLVGANTENENHQYYSLIQGQVCDYCDLTRPDKSHPAEYAIDGTENWWQSPPLSRGNKYNEVNLTIDFGQEFHVAYIFIRMGNSPRPGLWTLEKSRDYGKTWTPWQHFSDTPSDCETYFGKESLKPITRDDDVICTTEYSKIVPLENGEIPITLLNNRPSANNYFNSTILQEWTRATNVRIRLLRTKNLLGHLMSVARQDPTVTRRYFYSIKDISIGGRCMCNGHADTCHILDTTSPTRVLACQCQHNTCGIQCNECCPGFEQKKWRQNTNASPFQCEPCNCHGHSHTCVYDEQIDFEHKSLDIHGNYDGGGQCTNCQDNTEGINCNKCKPTFYRPFGRHWNETDVCHPCNCNFFYSTGNCAEETGACECRKEFQPPNCDSCAYGYYGYPNCKVCDCNLNGTDGYYCQADNGHCPCKSNFAGNFCEKCADGYFKFPECKSCECNFIGSLDQVCNEDSGQCQCKINFAGLHCDNCKNGYYDYPTCTYCNCDIRGTLDEVCEKSTGQCLCREGYGGPRCDQCIPGYYNYPDCVPCNCSTTGSISAVCDATGKCPCLQNFAGKQCNLCSAGYYKYPECLACQCESHGSNGISCNTEGQCLCHSNFDGKTCDICKEGFYNFPACEECNCDPAGVSARFAGCGSVPAGELCQCKSRVAGRICDQCKPLYWNLNITNPEGCEECDCFVDGTVGALDTCNTKTGQCACKPSVRGRSCDQCKDGTFDLFGGNLFGCKDCGCDIGGAINSICDKSTGQCKCHPRISGRTCSSPLTTHYYPTLYQYQYEYEDGRTPSGALVRIQHDETIFPNFSRKAYVYFSTLMREIINEVHIFKSSVYRVVIRYHNPTKENVIGTITIQSDNPNEVDQSAKVLFKPTDTPQFVTVSGPKGEIPSPIVLDPGHYMFTIKIDKPMYLDYFVLLPAAYYEASILTKKIENPCEVGNLGLCRHYRYPSIAEFSPVTETFTTIDGKAVNPEELFSDFEHLNVLKEEEIPLLMGSESNLNYIIQVPRAGRYVVVIDYITDRNNPETDIIRVNAANDESSEGLVTLYPCFYTMVCRQPVLDVESREKIFWIEANDPESGTLVLHGDKENRIGIKSVTAIPIESWSLDYINPSPVAVIQDGGHIKGSFRAVPDSKKIEFEADHAERIAEKRPTEIFDNSTNLIYLNSDDSSITLRYKVTNPGRYVILVKYFQPDHPGMVVLYRIETDRQAYDGKLNIRPCPSNIGCRELIKQDNGATWFDIEESFVLTLTNNQPHGVWLDFVLLVPTDQFNENLLEEETFDQTKEFIRKCGHDHYHIPLNATEFCKQSVFSLTSEHNDGALPCGCSIDGSTSLECDPFGGQCQCKTHIVGRQCDSCEHEYYGFPDCKPCNCPSTAKCDPVSGECQCPPRVTGEKCDQCAPYTFGFDQVTGCEDCNCNPLGVYRDYMQCDLNNGSCQCKPNVVGRQCDKCENGFYNFPYCEPCNCDTRGTTLDICDQVDETCFCKKNVVGMKCEQCAEGTYNLHASNPEGCTKCFCFGKTTRCHSAYLRPFNVSMMKDVSINTINVKQGKVEINHWEIEPEKFVVSDSLLQITDFSKHDFENGSVFFGALDFLLDNNNHLSAYGGYLTYKLFFTTGLFGDAIIGPDVILEGKDSVYIHQSYEQPANGIPFNGAVKMVESNFQTISGAPVTREQFMTLLRDLKGIYVRASYWEETVLSQLSDVFLNMADDDTENYHLYEELPVEHCQCPSGYVGMSCEDCAPGYYRDPNGPHGGYCIPCQCNGHAKTCDCNTGICHACDHFTTGDHCDQCIEGYYGNATNGSPHDCMICACPLPIESNNFASSCEVSEDGYDIHCKCRQGYTGATCESCAAGYFGNPRIEGETCHPCECSGNIDPTQPGSCDSVTGECLLCLNNTAGTACNLCKPGFFGDAIQKDCQSCICDELGMDYCDNYIGTCHCKPNVIGEKCDRCEVDHYGFDSGHGCRACDCGVASDSTQCDDHSGECRCKPGVTGRQCDRCLPGFFNYTSEGCVPCSCNTDYSRGLGCNPHTGQCECLPGVVGKNCDHCPYRWVLIPDSGCQECDICHHALLDVTDGLKSDLDPVILEFQTVAGGYFTAQKLNYLNDWADKIEPEVRALDPKGVNLNPINNEIETIEMDGKNFERRISYADQSAMDLAGSGNKLNAEAENVSIDCTTAFFNAQNAIREVKKLAESLENSELTKADSAKAEAEQILERIMEYKINMEPAVKQLNQSQEAWDLSGMLKLQSKFPQIELEHLRNDTKTLQNRLDDLLSLSKKSNEMSNEANLLNDRNREVTLNTKFDTLVDQMNQAQKHLEESKSNLKNTTKINKKIADNVKELDKQNYDLKTLNAEVDELLPKKEEEYLSKENLVRSAAEHADKIKHDAEDLKDQIMNIESNSEVPLQAAKAYTNIVENVNDAKKAVTEAKYATGNATEMTEGIDDRAGKSNQLSSQFLDDARDALNVVQGQLQPHIDKSGAMVTNIIDLNTDSDEKNRQINMALDQLSESPRTDVLESSKTVADKANKKAQNALKILNPIVKSLPQDVKIAKELPIEVDKTNKDITQINNQVEQVKVVLPRIRSLVDSLEKRQNHTNLISSDIGDKLGKLRRQVEMARDIANSIPVGVNFHPNTTLELKTPENLQLLATNSKISTFFKTDKPNGFLVYLGNEQPTEEKRSKHNDFMALEIENGYPVLTVDLGYGPERLINNKYVADGKWHQAIVDRTGNNIQLTIREELDDKTEKLHVANETLPGPFSVFNLDHDSRLFVGGYPPDFNIQPGVKYSSFEGQIESVKVGDNDVGLWNFVDGQDNNHGALERDRLLSKEPPTTGYRFNGNGYVILDSKPYSFKTRSSVQFKFKASRDTKDGLMFYAGKNRHFISIEMRDGGILFQFKIGQSLTVLRHIKQYNDDEWHQLEAVREGSKGVLTVDGMSEYEENTSDEENLRISETMYFGGYSGKVNHSEVTKQGFDGCIDVVHISGTPVDLNRNLKAYGTRRGCPVKFSSSLTFAPHQYGYLSKGNVSSDNYLQVNLKFKTKHEEGLLFYTTNHDQSSTFGLVLSEGQLYLSSNKERIFSKKINDGEWHIVTATHDSRGIRLDIDESLHYNSESPAPPLQISYGEIFFGGLPKNYRVPKDTLKTTAYFVGCINDVTVNGDIVNFAESRGKQNAILDNCPADMFNYDLWSVPNYYPEEVEEFDIDKRIDIPDEKVNENEIEEDGNEGEDEIIPPPVTKPPTTPKPRPKRPPPPDGKTNICQLPHKPDWDVDFDHGYRFGSGQFSRIEFTNLAIKPRRAYDISLTFKTDSPDGVLFYVSDASHVNFIALYLQEGHLVHKFNSSSGSVDMTSTFKYHNDEWHTVMFSRSQNKGKLIVDGDDINSAEAAQQIRAVTVADPYFVGGVSQQVAADVEMNLNIEKGSYFRGCVKDILVASRPAGDPTHMENVIPCSDQVETGTFFSGGYVKLRDKFKVGTDLTISMEIKPRTQNGLLLSVHGKRAFLIVQLLNGTISFVVDNGDGPFEAVFKPDANENFCDGEWRTVTVIKTKFVITVQVNKHVSQPTVGSAKTASADTTRPLFLGGHPFLQKVRGITARRPYYGCIRNVKIGDKPDKVAIEKVIPEPLRPERSIGDVLTGVCSTI